MSSSGHYYAHSFKRSVFRFLGRYYHYQTVKRNRETRILVILHLFYMSAWPEIQEYLKNLSPYNYSLIVTCANGFYDEETLSQIKAFKNDTKIIRCNNLGWDVLPFLIALRSIDLSNYDILFKLQSKGTKRKETYLYGQYFRKRSWFLNLFEGCIGPFTVHTSIDNLMTKDKRIGLVAARNLIVEDPIHKRHMVEQTLEELNLPNPNNYKFIAGTCFAIRANLMNRIQAINIDTELFNTKGFSLAHRIERILCFPPFWEGLKMVGPNVLIFRRLWGHFFPYARRWRKYNGVRILKDPRVHVDDEFAFRSIEPQLIKCWEFVDIKVGEIKRELYPKDNNPVPLSETLPYKYLVTRDSKLYYDYCEYNYKVWGVDCMSKERFDDLIYSMDTKGNTKENNIVLLKNNIIFDGQHRCCWLLFNNGPEYIINALLIKLYHPEVPLFCKIINSLRYRIPLILNYLMKGQQ